MPMTHYMFFLTFLLSGSLLTLSSSSWFMAWLGLEINLMSFIPLMMSTENFFQSEAALKYFLVQTLGSTGLIFSLSLNMISPNNTSLYISMILVSSLSLKMGGAPFHFWLPSTSEGMSWMNLFILLTIQKLAPMTILFSTLSLMKSSLLIMIIISSALLGALGGYNNLSIRKLLAFSSIMEISWLLSALYFFNFNTWTIIFIVYTLLLSMIMIMSALNNLTKIPSMTTYLPVMIIVNLTISFLSLGGLPPFLGFIRKWYLISLLGPSNPLLTLILIMSSLLILSFYLRIFIPLNLKSPTTNPLPLLISSWNLKIMTMNILGLSPLVLWVLL